MDKQLTFDEINETIKQNSNISNIEIPIMTEYNSLAKGVIEEIQLCTLNLSNIVSQFKELARHMHDKKFEKITRIPSINK